MTSPKTAIDSPTYPDQSSSSFSMLAPLDTLSPPKERQAIQTLQAYLDRQGSLSKTAEALHLHRNAVAYRINRIFSLLDVDRDNPDDLLLLQLA
jgi:DNA-binding PucR family transcriptional regulator